MQALYQSLLTGQKLPDIAAQFREQDHLARADEDYFDMLLDEVDKRRADLDDLIARLADRPTAQLDPVEHATLFVALAELAARPDIPYRVVIDEAINLSRRFGSTDGHRYVNAIVDRAARELRAAEYGRSRQ